MTNQVSLTPWLLPFSNRKRARVKIFCFPYAGGSASMYRSWSDALADTVEVLGIQLPGRENRLFERPIDTMQAIVKQVALNMQPVLDKPYMIYGHSMGALVGFELARYLQRTASVVPSHLILSSYRAPHLPNRHACIHQLETSQFLGEVEKLNGAAPVVFQDQELMQLALPMLRADFKLHETYTYVPGIPLACPMTVLGGVSDSRVSEEELRSWEQHTRGSFSLHMLNGGHFFTKTHPDKLFELVQGIIESVAYV